MSLRLEPLCISRGVTLVVIFSDLPETARPGLRVQAGRGERQAEDQAVPGRGESDDARPEGGVQVITI